MFWFAHVGSKGTVQTMVSFIREFWERKWMPSNPKTTWKTDMPSGCLVCHGLDYHESHAIPFGHVMFLLWHQGKMHQSCSTKSTKARPPGTNRIPSAKKTFKRFSLTILDSKQIWIACSVTEVWRLTPTCDLKLFLETWVLMKTWCFSAKYSTINYEPGWWLLHCCKQVRSAEANWRLSAILDQLCRILGLAKTGNILNTEPIWS